MKVSWVGKSFHSCQSKRWLVGRFYLKDQNRVDRFKKLLIVSIAILLFFIAAFHVGDGLDVGPGYVLLGGKSDISENSSWVEHPNQYQLRGPKINDLQWNPDFTLVAAASMAKNVSIIDPKVWPTFRTIDLPSGRSAAVSWSPNGSYLAVACHDASLVVYRASDWSVENRYTFRQGGVVRSLDFSPNGRYLAVGRDTYLHILDTANWTIDLSRKLDNYYRNVILRVNWSPNDAYIGIVDDGGHWIINATNLQTIMENSASRMSDFCWSPDSEYYVCTAETGIANVIPTKSDRTFRTLHNHYPSGNVTSADWLGDGSLLATAKQGSYITIWNTQNWYAAARMDMQTRTVTEVRWGANESVFATGDGESRVKFWYLGSTSVVYLDAGPRVYSRYRAYDFWVETNPHKIVEIPSKIELVLDPENANVTLECGLLAGGSYIIEATDPSDLVELTSDLLDIDIDRTNNSATVHFRVVFNWTWPHEEPCDVVVRTTRIEGLHLSYTHEAMFSVENDLDIIGEMDVVGEWQGILADMDWVRGGENLSMTGPIVVYQGTTEIFPPSRVCILELVDDRGTAQTIDHTRGTPLNTTYRAGMETDLDESLSLRMVDVPSDEPCESERLFRFRIDAEAPVIDNNVPDPDDWNCQHDVWISATALDGNTSGLDQRTIEYSTSMSGTNGYGDWTQLGLSLWADVGRLTATVSVWFPNGEMNYIRWRVRDRVGNLGLSGDIRIRVDTVNVTYTDPVPGGDVWLCELLQVCGVTVKDMEGSGIDVSSIQFRVSPKNLSRYCNWIDWEEGEIVDAREIVTRVEVKFIVSTYNYLQWRAKDIAGNGFTTSPHYRIKIDVLPIEFYEFEPTGDKVFTFSKVRCNIGVRDNVGGSGVAMGSIEYRMTVDGELTDWMNVGMGGVFPDTRFDLFIEFQDGLENLVQFRGLDVAGNGPTESPQFGIIVDTSPPEFTFISPGSDEKQSTSMVTIVVRIKEDISSIDSRILECSLKRDGDDTFSEWMDVNIVQTEDGYEARFVVELAPGEENRIVFRATDGVGNQATSEPHAIWVNRPPYATIESPSDGVVHSEDQRLPFSANGSMDPDGDVLSYAWYSDLVEGPILEGPYGDIVLQEGTHNITLVVRDGSSGVDKAWVTVVVEPVPPPRFKGSSEEFPWPILLILIMVIVGAMLVLWYRSRASTGRQV